ncbi:MFS transporter [Enemella evansiae]|uniref:MFS transporter n=1 Tax=Enemella evansiae TaxID=2016499 RepID=UPI000B97C9EA|nr:MFS transporter [Enemella evansiae]OYO11380.1 MFS transporter [Enemella evansiae]TDO88009.1 putative MFS family arabinose efflux permease [Enemella evansiae]
MTESIQWRKVAIAAYAPTLLVSIGYGAVLPLVALSAREMGASVGMAALVVGLHGFGQLVGDLPAGSIAAKLGEKKALIGAALVEAAAQLVAWRATQLAVLAAAVFVIGLAGAVFGLARQAYLTEVVPLRQRARALSTLGGMLRVGFFIGPLIAAAVVGRFGLSAAYAAAAVMTLAAAAFTLALPDVQPSGGAAIPRTPARLLPVIREHRKVLATLGTGAMVIMLGRAGRLSLLPLWAQAAGLSPQATSLIFAIAAFTDMAMFYPSGLIMDRFGRFWSTAPTLIVLGLGFALLPLTDGPWTIGLVAVLLGVGNGFSAGIVMTLGSDASPRVGRPQFLAAWRLLSDAGNTVGPFLISAVVAVAPLWAAAFATAVTCWAGAAWFVRWLPRGRQELEPLQPNP